MDRLIKFGALAAGLMLAMSHGLQAQTSDAKPYVRLVGPVGLVRQGEIFPVEIQLNSAGYRINAAEVRMNYPTDRVELIYVRPEQSIFTLWTEAPAGRDGVITMSGGRPGGIYASDAALATAYFRAMSSGPSAFTIDTSATAAYLHDGQGTRLELTSNPLELNLASDLVVGILLTSVTHPVPEYWSHGTVAHVGWVVETDSEYSYAFGSDPIGLPDDAPEALVGSVEFTDLSDGIYYFTIKQRQRGGPWTGVTQRRFLMDGTPPESFQLEWLPAQWVGGQPRLAWAAVDQTSGVAGAQLRVGATTMDNVTSPLPVEGTWYGQVAVVRVTDAAGNSTESSLRLPAAPPSRAFWKWGIWLAVIVIGGLGLLALWRRRGSR